MQIIRKTDVSVIVEEAVIVGVVAIIILRALLNY
jgi:hypothetical protein